MDKASPLLTSIEAARDGLSPSEARVADYILSHPNRAVELSISALSQAAGVSEPSVARFCKSIGFSGLREFKIRLAKSLGASAGTPFIHQDVAPGDDAGEAAAKVVNRAIVAFDGLRTTLDQTALKTAAAALAKARRLEFYGQGNSGIVALDAQHKFFRLGLGTVAYSDPHIHAMSAALLGAEDVVVAISASGRTLDLIRSVEIAREAGAFVIGITSRGSPLSRHCSLTLVTEVEEDADIYAPMTSRLVHLAVVDILAVLTALERGAHEDTMLKRAKQSVQDKRRAT